MARKHKLIIRRAAENEARQAYRWYGKQRSGLGDEFLLALESCIGQISGIPEAFPVVHEGTRRSLLRRFPYSVLFLIDDDRIVILAVFHARRDPKRWMSRK